MGSGFQGLEIARSGMTVNERALTVSSHNISNLNTKGYSRQQAITKDAIYSSPGSSNFQVGSGASMQETRQIRNEFLDAIYRTESVNLGYWQTREKTFKDVEGILGEPMWNGIQQVTNQFWDAWQELAKDPSSLTTRSLVRQRSEAFVEQLNYLGVQLNKLQADLDQEISLKVDEINTATDRIAELNVAILSAEAWRDNANDFRDERNQLVDSLKKLADVDVIEQLDGQIDVTLSGYVLASKGLSNKLYVAQTPQSGIFNQIKIDYANEDVPIHNGYLKGLLESRGEVFGAEDSISNGYPNSRADIVFAVDISQSGSQYLDKVKESITTYADEVTRRGIDFNLRLVTYSGNTVVQNQSFGMDTHTFVNQIRSLSTTGDNAAKLENAIDDITDATKFRKDVNKYVFLFTGESLSGDENFVDSNTKNSIQRQLTDQKIKAIIAAPKDYDNAGLPADPLGLETESGWKSIAEATGGKSFEMSGMTDYEDLFKQMSDFVNTDINHTMSNITMDNNIVPYALKKLNTFTNIILREINYLHSGGRTFGGQEGTAKPFFVAMNAGYPLKLGNISVNLNLDDLNNIAASATDAQGDNTIAVKIANIRQAQLFYDAKGLQDGDTFYQSFLMDTGTKSSEAARISETQKKLVDSADLNRQAVMGVSLDEEMTSVMKYKFAYNASSRALTMVDDMLDTIINKLGLTGR